MKKTEIPQTNFPSPAIPSGDPRQPVVGNDPGRMGQEAAHLAELQGHRSTPNSAWPATSSASWTKAPAPPHVSKNLLQPLPWTSDIVPILGKFEWFETRMLIHTDAKYVHKSKDFWAAYNGLIDGTNSEGSVWYGGIHPKLPNGSTLDVFKSWASRRFADPSNILYERKFIHPHITPQGIRAARSLKSFQGRNGLFFSGQATTGFDLQESAVYSAMKVADALAPASASLQALRARMQSRGRTNINYDL